MTGSDRPSLPQLNSPSLDKSDTMDYESGKKLEFKDHNDREVQGAHDEKVIEAFQKFDTDGSGNISRDELAEAERPWGWKR